ncbi:TonB-dependent receptor domain-containing protein [Sphingorhabdus sp. 109]|jgi:outer membrane receptor protein involved in Fe transport|uniref:TonB-dependent receptor domain-containing protein n=1 Tax=Sphingorhabdus sp. 109 TaxID=2653173 RepID=UPI0012EEFF8E|nr:TonB-dependent receptor [Sphingorhabdus sp. 109]VWX59003.1 TonB-dependent receptor [Sphingorhabdus sp. 109]
MTKFTKLKATVAPMVLGIAMVSVPAFAQEEGAADEQPGELIVVTGSRIASATVESAAPLQVVSAESIDDAGVTNVQELLLENPVFGTPGLSRTNSAFLTSGTGVATVDLRDLGSDRTLVLINGRRVVASVAGSATVDLNVIPTQFVERVDILTGGASSLYGSDAVAGVVNFVYKSNFEGIEANAQYGITERGDDARYQMNVTAGTNFADGDGNLMVHFGYSNEEGLLSKQRSNTQIDALDSIYFGGDYGTDTEPFFSSFPPQGRFITPSATFTYAPNGQLQDCFTTNGDTCTATVGPGLGPNGFNRQQFRTLAVPVQRYLFAAAGEYALSDDINFFFEGTFNKTSSSRIIEPFPLESGGSNGIFPTDGGYNVENYLPGTTTIVANPFVPTEILNAATDSNGDGLRDIGFVRRLAEFGPRSGRTERDFYRFVVGFDGGLFDDRFRWDVSYNYGQVNENQTSSGQVNVVNFRDALAVMTDVNDLNGNGLTTDAICIDAEARANGCVAANIFGAGSISQGAVDYIQAQGTYQTGLKQQVLQGNLSGTLLDLPAGPLGIAVGVEYRKESSFSDNDALTNQGLNAGNVLPDTSGSFDVKEAFAEIKVPILADTPGFQLLEVGGAIRVSDYSTVGSVVSYNGTATWQPIDDLRIRGTYARAVRAPNIGELFAGLSQTFPSGLIDPCEGIGATGGGATGDNCRADAGVAANIAANGVFTLNQADIQGISGFNGGNPDLFEETADSWTVGAVIAPRSIPALGNLTITADYYNIEITDVISGFPRQFSLQQCYDEGNSTFCDLIVRRQAGTAVNSVGSIDLINALQVNAAVLKTSGVDVTASWSTPLGLTAGDRLSLRGAYTHVIKNDFFSLPTADADPSAGEIGTAKDRFTANATYSTDDFKVGFTGTFIGKSYEDDQFDGPKAYSVPAYFLLDMNTSFYVTEKFEFYFGVDNLLDKSAPNILTGTPFNVTGSDTAADVYDVFGRRYYTGVRLRF